MPRVISDALRAAAQEGGQSFCQIDILEAVNKKVLLTTSDDPLQSAPRMSIVSGDVIMDATSDIQGEGEFVAVADAETLDSVIPTAAKSPLSPVAKSLLQISFKAPGDTLTSDWGRYEISDLEVDETPAGITLHGRFADNSRKVQRARFTRPLTVAKGLNFEQVIFSVLEHVIPDSEFSMVNTTRKTQAPQSYDIESDRLALVKEMLLAIGYQIDWNWNGRGDFRSGPMTDEEDDPIWTFTEGGNSKILNVKRHLSDEKAYNGVIAMGEATASDKPPVRAEYWDTNPESPTYFDPLNPDASWYGPVPFFYVSRFITSKRQAQDAAKARLPSVRGVTERLSLSCLRNPGITINDPIYVDRRQLGAIGTFLVQRLRMPLRAYAGSMTLECRERRVLQ